LSTIPVTGVVDKLETTSPRTGATTQKLAQGPEHAVQLADDLAAQRVAREAQQTDLELFNKVQSKINQARDQANRTQAATAAGKMARVKAFKQMGRVGQTMDAGGLDAVEKLVNASPDLTAEEYDAGMAVLKGMDTAHDMPNKRGISGLSRAEKNIVFNSQRDLEQGYKRIQAAVLKRPAMSVTEWNDLLATTFTNPVVADKGRMMASQLRPKDMIREDNLDKANAPFFIKWQKEWGFSQDEAEWNQKNFHRDPNATGLHDQFIGERVPGSFRLGPDGKGIENVQAQKPDTVRSVQQAWSANRVLNTAYRPTQEDEPGTDILKATGVMTARDIQYFDDYRTAKENVSPANIVYDGEPLGSKPGILSRIHGGLTPMVDHAAMLYDKGKDYEDAVEASVKWGKEKRYIVTDIRQRGEYLQLRSQITDGVMARKQAKFEAAQKQIAETENKANEDLANALSHETAFPKLSLEAKKGVVSQYGLQKDDGSIDYDKLPGAINQRVMDTAAKLGLGGDSISGDLLKQTLLSVPQQDWPEYLRVAYAKADNDFMEAINSIEMDRERKSIETKQKAAEAYLKVAEKFPETSGPSQWMNRNSPVETEIGMVANSFVADLVTRVQAMPDYIKERLDGILAGTARLDVSGVDADKLFENIGNMLNERAMKLVDNKQWDKLSALKFNKVLKRGALTPPVINMDGSYGSMAANVHLEWLQTDDKATIALDSGEHREFFLIETGLPNSIAGSAITKLAGSVMSGTEKQTLAGIGVGTIFDDDMFAENADEIARTCWNEGNHQQALERCYWSAVDKQYDLAATKTIESLVHMDNALASLRIVAPGLGLSTEDVAENISFWYEQADEDTRESFSVAVQDFLASAKNVSGTMNALEKDLHVDRKYAANKAVNGLPSARSLETLVSAINKAMAYDRLPDPYGYGPGVYFPLYGSSGISRREYTAKQEPDLVSESKKSIEKTKRLIEKVQARAKR